MFPSLFLLTFLSFVSQPAYMRFHRSMFDRRTTFGDLIASYSCGIICGIGSLWEAEGMAEVDTALNAIWPVISTRPELLFYDLACARWTYLVTHPDILWAGTRLIVDR